MEIKEKVDEYGRLDSQMKDLKKTMDVEKDEIKNYMIENAMDSYSADDYKVQCVKSTKTAMNEAGTLSVLKEYWEKEHGSEECPFVKTIEVLNHDELEKSLYHNEFPAEVMSKLNECITTTETYALKCAKIKK